MCISVPMQVVEIFPQQDDALIGIVSYEGARKQVSLAAVPEAQVGDYVLVQFGFATSRLEAEDAIRTLELLRELDNLFLNDEQAPLTSQLEGSG
jgi:hydrogenase expression/formation protein HypC